jgi:2-succinyl-5-enolpyruvyl-6-hydroxy-3-cyclohexene-1-carboxylate synthase
VLTWRWAATLVDAFAAAGISDIVISPGSRSTPFVLAADAHARLRCHDVLDERSAAFFALGMARATGRPALFLCTSGTAPAHAYPAVIEAAHANIPLVVLSADRPFDLVGCGAPQTIDQIKLFGGFARRSIELGLPDEASLPALGRVAAQAVAASLGPTPGAVHVNVRARKPLEPGRVELPPPGPPPTRVHAGRRAPPPEAIAAIAALCRDARHGVLIAGPAPAAQAGARTAVARLAARTGFPLLAEAASQLRFTGGATPPDPALLAQLPTPDLVLQLGAVPTAGLVAAPRVVIAPHGHPDPDGTALHLVAADVAETAAALADALEPTADVDRQDWTAAAAARARKAADAELAAQPWSEGHVARAVVASLRPGAQLAIGNSRPIRSLDAFAPARAPDCVVLSQRGVNGIDGLVSAAAGAACATARPTTLLLGDVSLLHDLTGLHAARHARAPLTIVVVNNDGGRIFEQLPVAAVAGDALRHFTTPHGLGFAAAAELFGVRYARVDDAAALAAALARAEVTTLIEARTHV